MAMRILLHSVADAKDRRKEPERRPGCCLALTSGAAGLAASASSSTAVAATSTGLRHCASSPLATWTIDSGSTRLA